MKRNLSTYFDEGNTFKTGFSTRQPKSAMWLKMNQAQLFWQLSEELKNVTQPTMERSIYEITFHFPRQLLFGSKNLALRVQKNRTFRS